MCQPLHLRLIHLWHMHGFIRYLLLSIRYKKDLWTELKRWDIVLILTFPICKFNLIHNWIAMFHLLVYGYGLYTYTFPCDCFLSQEVFASLVFTVGYPIHDHSSVEKNGFEFTLIGSIQPSKTCSLWYRTNFYGTAYTYVWIVLSNVHCKTNSI